MLFARDALISLLVFAIFGALHAAGAVSQGAKVAVQSTWLYALIAFAVAQSIRGGFGRRRLYERMRSLAAAWLVLAAGAALGVDDFYSLGTVLLAITCASMALPAISMEGNARP